MQTEATASAVAAGRRVLLGLIGSGIQASLTPAMQMREAREHGLQLHYQLIDLDRTAQGSECLPELIDAIRTIGFDGFNVTFPCKQAVIPLLDDVADDARAIGAINTVVLQGSRLIGHNTDCSGWRWGFERQLPEADLGRVVLIGAGGAGSAIGEALMTMGCQQLSIVDTEHDRARALAQGLARRHHHPITAGSLGELPALMKRASGLVHATPIGMVKLPGSPIDPQLLTSRHWVSEVVYFPIETELIKAARERGCPVSDGGGMAVGQAIGAFEIFTGLRADPRRVAEHFSMLLNAQASDRSD